MLVCSFLLVLGYLIMGIKSLLVGTWNMQNFGPNKVEKENVMKRIVQIIKSHDLIALQEITDRTGESQKKLKQRLGRNYEVFFSPTIGAGGYSEQYGVAYKSQSFNVTGIGFYKGPLEFRRPPYFVEITKVDDGFSFGMGIIHTSPKYAELEVNNLAGALDWYIELVKNENVFMIGDFNCACSYVTQSDYINISLYTRPEFRWLTPTCLDTTVNENTNCAYDRIVLRGVDLWRKVIPESTEVFDYKARFKLTQVEAEEISDHFPVGLKMGYFNI